MKEKQTKTMHVGVIGAGMISRTYLDTLATKFQIVKVTAIADLTPKLQKMLPKNITFQRQPTRKF